MQVLALIPAYNEAAHITGVIQDARAHLPVLVVDDGSTDDTALKAEAAGAAVLRQTPNQGKGAALRAGFRRAIEDGYDAVLTLDADGQHDPVEIPRFLQAHAERKADLIIGARTFAEMPLVRRVSNTVGTWTFSWAIGQPIPDNQSGYRLVSRRLMEALLDSSEGGFVTVEKENLKNYTSLSKWEKVLSEYPRLKINLAHFPVGEKTLKTFPKEKRLKAILELISKYDNVYADFSNRAVNNKYYASLRKLIDSSSHELRTKLKNRILFGSDFTINLLQTESYNKYLDIFSRDTSFTEEKNDFCSTNPERFLFSKAK